MFGKVYKVDKNVLYIQNESHQIEANLMNQHVIFEGEETKKVGEIISLDEQEVRVLLVGEIKNNVFSAGIVRKPLNNAKIRLIQKEELELILGKQDDKSHLLLGASAIYPDFSVSVSLNEFFSNHSAIIGNTGAGKSCGVTRILQNLFSQQNLPQNAHIVLFDAYGEYTKAFSKISQNNQINYKTYTIEMAEQDEEILRIPTNFLESDDLALLLSIESSNQIPVLEKTLKLVSIFKDTSIAGLKYKNDIIAKCLLEVLTGSRSPVQKRDQIIAILSKYYTKTLNLDSMINQPGYYRTLRQCLRVDEQGKINSIVEVINFLKQFERLSFEDIPVIKGLTYSLDDLYYALEFALISEGAMNSENLYEKNNILKSRLKNVINSKYANIFSDEKISQESFVLNFFRNSKGENVQIVDVNLSGFDDRFAKVLTKIYSKIFFQFTTKLKMRGSFPINIILEEAHRYVQNDTDIDIIGYNIFDRITKEGRKYGTMMTFITQRPSELSTTSLSQCANFLVFRTFHPKDIEIIKNMSSNVDTETIEKLKTINPGTAFIFGIGIKIPILVKFRIPDPMPESTSVNLENIWYQKGVE